MLKTNILYISINLSKRFEITIAFFYEIKNLHMCNFCSTFAAGIVLKI